jgi:hypothetical protein
MRSLGKSEVITVSSWDTYYLAGPEEFIRHRQSAINPELTIKRKSEHIDFLRSFENPKANPSSSDLVYASGEGEVSFQIKGTSTNNTLELDNGSILSR